MIKKIFYLNEQGQRKNIEDTIFPAPGTATLHDRLFLVCDGVGGENHGEDASRVVCESIPAFFKSFNDKKINRSLIEEAVQIAIGDMKDYAGQHPEAERMSTTLTLAYIQQDGASIAWCGDSRIYHIRKGKVIWRSKDHSLVQQLIDSGEISEEEAATHPQKNIILRSLSAADKDIVNIDTHFISNIADGDYLLLCTDGVLEQINPHALMAILGPQQKEKNKTSLFLRYCEGRTHDNFSLYLLELKGKSGQPRTKKHILMVIALLVTAVLCGLFFYGNNEKNEKVKPLPKHSPPVHDSIIQKNTDKTLDKDIINQLNKKVPAK